jgi:transposase-like protein
MLQKLHKNARTNYAVRQEIRDSLLSINQLSIKYGLSWKTVKKWKERKSVDDHSSRPKRIRTSLNRFEEDLIVFERKKYKKTIEEIFFSLDGIVPNIYPVKIYRCLARHGLSVLPEELVKAERKVKRFRRYTIGYLHIDTLYTPKISDKKKYIFTCIDRVNKVAFVWLSERKTKEKGLEFLKKVISFYPYKIHYILTDNGGEFTNKAYKGGKAKKVHPFSQYCRFKNISHRTIKYKHPWTNGMVERFNGKIKTKVFRRYIFEDIKDLEIRLIEYINHYNFDVRLRQLNYKTPADFLREKYNHSVQRIVS